MDLLNDFELFEPSTPTTLNKLFSLKQALHSLVDDKLTKEDLLSHYEETYRLRHDAAHLLLSQWLNIDVNLGLDKSIQQWFPNIKFEKKQHPDIVHIIDSCVILGDVSVSTDINMSRAHKTNKYQSIVDVLTENGYKIFFITFILKPSLNNLQHELLKIDDILEGIIELDLNQFHSAELSSFFVEVDDVQHQLRELISNDTMLKDRLKERYASEDIFSESNQCDDFPTLNYKTLQSLKNYQFKGEDEIINMLETVLADEKLKQKICEQPTKPKHFSDAYEQLEVMNDSFTVDDAKPSIYTPLIGLNDYSNSLESQNFKDFPKEQQTILHVLEAFSNHVNSDERPAFNFILDISKSIRNMFLNDFREINKNLFCNGFYFSEEKDEDLRKQYHEFRKDQKEKKHVPYSFSEFLQKVHNVKLSNNNESKAIKTKIVKIPHNDLSESSKTFFNKAHVGTTKNKKNIELDLPKKYNKFRIVKKNRRFS